MTSIAAAYSRAKRAQAKAAGLCVNCRRRPALIKRTQCDRCTIVSVMKEAMKYDRSKRKKASSQARGTCYVPYYSQDLRESWNQQVIEKWTGRCSYSGIPIELGSTAVLDHKIPVARADVFGPAKVYHPDNLVWCHKAINMLKGDMTADEFASWLRNDLLAILSATV